MKRILILTVLTVLAAFLLTACQRTEKRVETVAETFLNAYYTADYAAAAALCTPRLAEMLDKAAEAGGDEGASALIQERAQKMKEALSQTSFQIVSVEVDEDAASARVHYNLSVPGLEQPVPMSLKLQLEGRTARVDGIE